MRFQIAPLTSAEGIGAPDTALKIMLHRETRDAVRAAIAALPDAQREAVLLYYVGGRSCPEIAAFLEIPVSTVKNRLHTARRRLRERMEYLMNDTLDQMDVARPSRGEAFRDRVFARLYAEYREQAARDPLTADRSLLTQARENLLTRLDALNPVEDMDSETAHEGALLLLEIADYPGAARLLTVYLSGKLSPSEEVWAKFHLLFSQAEQYDNALCQEVRQQHPAFVRRVIDLAAERKISLSERGRNLPVAPDDAARMPDACIPLWALGSSAIPNNYIGAGDSLDSWIALTDQVLEKTPKTAETREARFGTLYARFSQLALSRRLPEALNAIAQIRVLAEEDPGDARANVYRVEALEAAMYAHNHNDKDAVAIRAIAEEAVALLDSWEAGLAADDSAHGAIATGRHNVAFLLMATDQYDLSGALFDQLIAAGRANEWAYLWRATGEWATTHNRAAVLPLLRQAASRYRGEDFLDRCFRRQRPFAEVYDDAEFIAAMIV